MRRIIIMKIKEMLRLHFDLKLTQREISDSIGVSQPTVCEYIRRFDQAQLSWPLSEDLDDESLNDRLFPKGLKESEKAFAIPDYAYVFKELKRKGVTLNLLWREYLEANPNGYKYSQFCELYRQWSKKIDVYMPQTHKAGEKLFIDYAGQTVTIYNDDGTTYEAQIFIATMGASNYTYIEATKTQTLQDWIGSHERMLRFFGGSTKVWVPDNLKSGVTKSDRYEPLLNRTYLELAKHYGVSIIPARVRTPKDKSKAEKGVQDAERNVMAVTRDKKYFCITELSKDFRALMKPWNEKPFQKIPGSRLSHFEEIDKPALKPLPIVPYSYATWKIGRIGLNYHVNVDGHFYSAPYTYARESVEIKIAANTVEIYAKGKQIAVHVKNTAPQEYTTNPNHRPKHHQFYAECNTENFLRKAGEIGQEAEAWIRVVLNDTSRHIEQCFKTSLGALALAKKYGNSRFNAACKRAACSNLYTYKNLESILKKRLDQQPMESSEKIIPLPQQHECIRGANYYQ